MSPCTIPCIDSRGNRVATLSVTNDAGRVLSVAYTNAAGYSVGYTVTLPNGGTFRREIVRDPAFPEHVLACTNYFGSTAVTGFAYAYDLLGRPVSRNADAFAYDTRGQVTNVVRGGLYPETDAYSYDLAGNRTFSTDKVLANQTWTANALNQYTNSTWNGFSHDADGGCKGPSTSV